MVFLKERTVNGITYFYASESVSEGGKNLQKDVYYFGNRKPTKHEWQAVLDALEGKDVYEPKEFLLSAEQRTRLEALNARMKHERSSMSAAEKENFLEKFYNDYIYNTNSIEGSTLSPEQTYFVTHEKQGVEGKTLKEIYMARNLMNAVEYLQKVEPEKGKAPISLDLIRQLHSIVQESIQPKEELGKFKTRQNYITGTEYLPTPPRLVDSRMEGLMRWMGLNRGKCHPFELAALFHLKYVGIHPFVDGNGRTARLLHNLILEQAGFVPMIWRASTKQRYYSALRNAQAYGGHQAFLDYTLDEFVATYESV